MLQPKYRASAQLRGSHGALSIGPGSVELQLSLSPFMQGPPGPVGQQGPTGPPGPPGSDASFLAGIPVSFNNISINDVLAFNGDALVNLPQTDLTDGGNF